MKTKINPQWTTEWPKETGLFWFYGYRYGKISCGNKCKPELMLVKAQKIQNGFMYLADGNFMFKRETEEAHFLKAELPKIPKIES